MTKLLKKVFRADGKELNPLLWILLFGAFLGIGCGLFDLASVAVFLESYNTSSLPGAIICSGLLGIFAANTFISLQNWISYTKVATLTLLALILLFFTMHIVFRLHPSHAMIYFGFVLTGPVNALVMLLFWGLFERLFDLAQGRRLSASAESGMVIATVSALLYIAFTSSSYFDDPAHLYLVSFWMLVFALVTLVLVSYKNEILTKIEINVQYIQAYNNYKKLIGQKYILLLAAFSFLSAITYYFTDFTYLHFVGEQYGKEDTVDFLAGFSAATIAAGFLLQVFVLRWVNEKYGYQVSLLVLPALLGLFTAIYGILGSVEGYDKENSVFFFIFMLVCISRLLSVSLFRSLEFNTFKFFFMPLENLLRADVQSKIERVVRETGKVVVGLILVAFTYYSDFQYLPYFLLGVIVLWAFITVRMNEAYRNKLLITLEKPEEVIEKKERVKTSIVTELVKAVPSAGEKEIRVYLSLLKILDPVVYKDSILKLLGHENEDIQEIALLETSELCLLPAIPILERIQISKYYPVLKTRDLIDKVYGQLKASEFRLEKVKYIEQLTLSKLRRERVLGTLLAAYAEESMKPRLLNKLFRDFDMKVRYSAVVSAARSTSLDLQKNLIEKLGDTRYSNAALSALTETGEEAFPAMENAFYLTGQEEKIQLRIVQAYGNLGTENAVQILLKKLSYTNQNVSRAAFEAVSGCGYNITGERTILFKAELEEYVNVLVWNMSALLDLQKAKVSDTLIQAMVSEIESNYSSIFKLLTLLYDPKTIALIQENIFSQDPEKSQYAFGLLEVTLAENIKPFLLPVLTNTSWEEKVVKMQAYFPTESLGKVEALYDLIQRDYKYVNRWTKACALKELSEEKGDIDTDIFIANVINPDSLMKETASVALYLKAPGLCPPTFDRFKRELGVSYSNEIADKISVTETVSPVEYGLLEQSSREETKVLPVLVKTVDYFTAPDLKFEIIKFLKCVAEFSEVPGIILLEVAKITSLFRFKQGEMIAAFESPEDADYFLVRTGQVTLRKNGQVIRRFEGKSFLHNYSLLTDYNEAISLTADSDCEIYRIRQEDFNEVMSFFEEIPRSILKSIKTDKRETKTVDKRELVLRQA